jgi:hypothetical protein
MSRVLGIGSLLLVLIVVLAGNQEQRPSQSRLNALDEAYATVSTQESVEEANQPSPPVSPDLRPAIAECLLNKPAEKRTPPVPINPPAVVQQVEPYTPPPSQPKPSPPKVDKVYVDPVSGFSTKNPNAVVLLSWPNCGTCDDWDRRLGPLLLRAERPWDYAKVTPPSSFQGSTPYFRILIRGQWRGHKGWLSMDQLQVYINESTTTNTKPSKDYTSYQGKIKKGTYDGTSRWTYPGDILQHLSSNPHNYDVEELSSMSKDELEALHDKWHDEHGPFPPSTESRVYRRPLLRLLRV